MSDNRSKKFVFVPFCVLSQAYQADGIVKYEYKGSLKPIIQVLMDNDVNIIQMPCAESGFSGLIRNPQGLSKYNTNEFNKYCNTLAENVVNQIIDIAKIGYEVVAIMGIEHSPSCCVNYIYTNKGMEKRKGLFIEKIYDKLKEKNINIPMIGINRKYIRKSCKELDKLLKTPKNN